MVRIVFGITVVWFIIGGRLRLTGII